MSGPRAKDPSTRARRNEVRKGFTALPAAGRQGATPPWPLRPLPQLAVQLETARDRVAQAQIKLEEATDGRTKGRLRRELNKQELLAASLEFEITEARDAEVALWTELWRTPQATVWESSFASREVAQYVRWKVAAEQGNLKAASEARQLSDRLGLNPLALVRLNLEIERTDEAQERGTQRRQKAAEPAKRRPPSDPRGTLRAV